MSRVFGVNEIIELLYEIDAARLVHWWQIVSDHDAWDWQVSLCLVEGCTIEMD